MSERNRNVEKIYDDHEDQEYANVENDDINIP